MAFVATIRAMGKHLIPIAFVVSCTAGTESASPDPTSGHGGEDAVTTTSTSTTSASSASSGSPAGEVDGSRIKRTFWTATDGAQMARAIRDTLKGVDCALMTAEDGATRCLPSPAGVVVSDTFSDAACTVGVALASCNVIEVGYAIEYLPDCGGTRVVRLSNQAPFIYRIQGGDCVAQPMPPGSRAYGVVGPVAPEEWVSAE